MASVPAVRSTQSSCRQFEVLDVISNNWREPSSQDWSGCWDEREQCQCSALRWVGQWTSVNAVADASRQQSNISQLDNAQGSRRIHSTYTNAGVQGWSVICPPCDYHLSHPRLLSRLNCFQDCEFEIEILPGSVFLANWSGRPSRLCYLLHQRNMGSAKEDAHMAIVTLKGWYIAPLWEI